MKNQLVHLDIFQDQTKRVLDEIEVRNIAHFTAYRLAAMLSAALSRAQFFPLFVVFRRTPLPPAAQASSYNLFRLDYENTNL